MHRVYSQHTAKDLVEHQGEDKSSQDVYSQPSYAAQDSTRRKMLFLFKFLDTGSSDFRKIFCLLFMENINDIIDSDQSHKMILVVYHWNSQQVIFGDDTRHFLLVGIDLDFDDIFIHQIFQTGRWFCHYEF